MDPLKIAFHHLGLACRDFTNAVKFHETLGYTCSDPVVDPLQNVELIYCASGKFPDVELIREIDASSPVTNYLKTCDELIYHVCYEIGTEVTDIKELFPGQRIVCLSKPKPAILFNNRMVSFYYINGVGLTEILHAAAV